MIDGVSVPENVVSDTIGADTIVINISSGSYYTLTPAGAEVWRKIVDDSVHSNKDVAEALHSLVNEGLVNATVGLSEGCVVPSALYVKYSDMEDLLIADPIHEVGPDGWPHLL